MTKTQFDIIVELSENKSLSKEQLSLKLFKDEEQILADYNRLIEDGYLVDNQLTDKALNVLKSHKIDNATILAAGMSTRFVPLNYELPKGLLPVNGETLIERQIRQLHEKGIEEIVVVVGYMKEAFRFLTDKYNVILVETDDFEMRNNHASVYAARKYLKNSIITSSDLYFTENIFQTYAYDSYYCTIYIPGKTAERGIITDADDKILKTMYGDKCCDIWVTLGYAYFSQSFSAKMIDFIQKEFNLPETTGKFWADIQDDHLSELYMYAKRCPSNVINEFDSLEELRLFDAKYQNNSGSKILKNICYRLGAAEGEITHLESLKKIKYSLFKFLYKDNWYICDVKPDDKEKLSYLGRVYYQCHDQSESDSIKLFKMDKNILIQAESKVDTDAELRKLLKASSDFIEYHKQTVPLCAAENVCSEFTNLPLSLGFQERYIMNNTYSFNMDDNFIGCEKLYPFYQMISETCERIFGAKYTDPRPFTGMHCIDMITKTVCKAGEKMMILGKEYGGHASVAPVVERLGVKVYEAPYDLQNFDIDYIKLNHIVKSEKIDYILLAPSDIITPLDVEKIDTSECVLMWDCSQLMGLIAGGLCANPLKTKRNIIMFGGTHKTFPGPASGLIMTNEKYLHDKMETEINPKYLRHSQMHQKISLLYALIEFEKYGKEYMSHMVHCSNYLGEKLRSFGFSIADCNGQISKTHQIFIYTSKDLMNTIYDNAYKCKVTLNKKTKKLFNGFGIRLGTQEIARYDWNDKALDIVAEILYKLSLENCDVQEIERLKQTLPPKIVHFCFGADLIKSFEDVRNI